jgi:hypothetical protein
MRYDWLEIDNGRGAVWVCSIAEFLADNETDEDVREAVRALRIGESCVYIGGRITRTA